MQTRFTKDPSAVLDYAADITAWLATGETIMSHTVTPATGITLDSHSAAAGIITAWLSGGTAGIDYDILFHWTTSAGRTDERTMTIAVRDR